MSSPTKRSIWLITMLLFTFVFAVEAPTPDDCGIAGDAPMSATECTTPQLSLTADDGSLTRAVPLQPTTSNGAVVWIWVAFSGLGLAVLTATVAANRPPRKSTAGPSRVPPLQESLAQLDRAS